MGHNVLARAKFLSLLVSYSPVMRNVRIGIVGKITVMKIQIDLPTSSVHWSCVVWSRVETLLTIPQVECIGRKITITPATTLCNCSR